MSLLLAVTGVLLSAWAPAWNAPTQICIAPHVRTHPIMVGKEPAKKGKVGFKAAKMNGRVMPTRGVPSDNGAQGSASTRRANAPSASPPEGADQMALSAQQEQMKAEYQLRTQQQSNAMRQRVAAAAEAVLQAVTNLAQHAPALFARLEDSDRGVRWAAVETLGKLDAAAGSRTTRGRGPASAPPRGQTPRRDMGGSVRNFDDVSTADFKRPYGPQGQSRPDTQAAPEAAPPGHDQAVAEAVPLLQSAVVVASQAVGEAAAMLAAELQVEVYPAVPESTVATATAKLDVAAQIAAELQSNVVPTLKRARQGGSRGELAAELATALTTAVQSALAAAQQASFGQAELTASSLITVRHTPVLSLIRPCCPLFNDQRLSPHPRPVSSRRGPHCGCLRLPPAVCHP